MKIFKKNQIIISVIALMLITVGYMNYTSNITGTVETGALLDSEKMAGIGDAKLVNSNNVVNDSNNDSSTTTKANEQTTNSNIQSDNIKDSNIVNNDNEEVNMEGDIGSSTSNKNNVDQSSKTAQTTQVSAGTASTSIEYFASSKLERDKMYSQMLETYQKLVESASVSNEQKTISTQEIANINNTTNSIMIAENLIKNLGYDNVVIFVNDNSVSVIIKTEKLEEADVAKIQNIVCREIGVEVEKVHISLK